MLEQIESFSSQPLKQQIRVVEIYIRIVSTKSIKIKLPSQVEVIKLKQIIQQKFMIEIQDQILFLKGVKLNFDGVVLLENKWIVHVIDKRLVDSQFISFHLKTQSLTSFKKELPAYYTVKSDQVLQQFIQDNVLTKYSVKLSQVLVVESGRFLKLNQTFKEQYVQSGTEINVLHVQRDKNKSTSSATSEFQNQLNLNTHKQNHQIPEKNISQNKIQQLSFKKKDEPQNKVSSHTQRIPKIMTARNSQPTSDFSFKFNKTTVSNLYLNSPRVNPKNRSIPVGHKQCNCHPKKPKQIQIISIQDRKKRQKEIREMNLQKMIIKKQKQNQIENSSASLKGEQKIQHIKNLEADKLSQSQSTSSKLKKVKSLDTLNLNYLYDKQKPQTKNQKCQYHNNQNQSVQNQQQNHSLQQLDNKKISQNQGSKQDENNQYLLLQP